MLTIYVSILPINMSKFIMGAVAIFIHTRTQKLSTICKTTVEGDVDKSM